MVGTENCVLFLRLLVGSHSWSHGHLGQELLPCVCDAITGDMVQLGRVQEMQCEKSELQVKSEVTGGQEASGSRIGK